MTTSRASNQDANHISNNPSNNPNKLGLTNRIKMTIYAAILLLLFNVIQHNI